ncbi:DUF6271 family protein [Streptomyces beihaiensis]|uniref:DUF6271 family protein n=1 Tax=Streptomyces beihaiensis TaxID=2984495 RepID=A0ABT3TP42_9ACTN|nr:DUF6271 family protein [Streptomyces beihaiensis]MCX3058804.1 DUF6271 family protein [Streptomyces beihaiensis]
MGRICLTLPTNRSCSPAISAIGQEAAYAADTFGADVELLILDSSDAATHARHAAAVKALPRHPRITVHHLDEEDQRQFLRRVVHACANPEPDRMLDLLLPDSVSYGACTDRAFLYAAALGCDSVHRRDSDSRYQTHQGAPVFPVHHELRTLGRPAADAARAVDRTDLDDRHMDRPVAMTGASFVGELSVDIAEMKRLDPATYTEVVGLWAPADWSAQQRRELAEESFRGSGETTFTEDRSTLCLVDPMRVDMCNIAFHAVHERVPLPPATDTIGSDYFLIHLVHDAELPGVLHNRDIVNFHTPHRGTDTGFLAYQRRFVKFLLSMLYFHHIYRRMARAGGDGLLDGNGQVRTDVVAALARESATLDRAENIRRLDTVDAAYRRLGGRWQECARRLKARRGQLLDEAQRDIEDFAALTEAWPSLVGAARATPVSVPHLEPAR